MNLRAWLLQFSVLCGACGGSSKDCLTEPPDAAWAKSTDGGTPLRRGVAYTQGVYSCCDEGLGRGCCDQGDQTCLPYGGVYGHCLPEGAELDGKVICGFCCEGLARVDAVLVVQSTPSYPDGCDYDHAPGPGLFYCARCGDRQCGVGENRCNCPADCEGENEPNP